MIYRSAGCFVLLLSCLVAIPAASGSENLAQSLEVLRHVALDGKDNAAAARAWKVVAAADAERLPEILSAIDGATPLGANWLRTAAEAIAERELREKRALPRKALQAFVLDTDHHPRARFLAYRWLVRSIPEMKEELLPKLAQDPSVELRREAVARLIAEASKIDAKTRPSDAITAYRRALEASRDEDQVRKIAGALKKLGQKVDLPRHFGFLTDWKLIAPFDNSGRRGFDTVYPPERELNEKATYKGKTGIVRWQAFHTDHPFGLVDFNRPYGKLKEVVGYAWADFYSPRKQQVELRLGCKNAWKLWLNSEFIFGRDEYHRGMQMDQYRYRVTLRPGVNRILLKVCQNEQQEDWTVQWEFQLRVCDETGTAILSERRSSP